MSLSISVDAYLYANTVSIVLKHIIFDIIKTVKYVLFFPQDIARITRIQVQVTSLDTVDCVFIISLWFGWWKCIKILSIHH